jgi:RNA polymerase sigma factor (TIGR02999 family)
MLSPVESRIEPFTRMSSAPSDTTELLLAWNAGDQEALNQLMPLVYDELRRLARHYLRRERADHPLQSTALVHEAWLRLVQTNRMTWQHRAHFIGVAAEMMQRILVDHARQHLMPSRAGTEPLIKVAWPQAVQVGV